ncbi:GNAT family N-acetyltransferase [Fibrisoma montanum]|uniref:GNAT family N-acetyltransferase n=1 Tax=Fibrisoma montanum TaxID=2305895 RepID=A0A418M985_9BACT|nr:GNAT family N-acetyltransferase [Fibrisoma montanum]RIV22652.1 GNAT family N-acetyltransferase [Fibrisoma montanum]
MHITTIQSEADIQGILALQRQNLRKNVTPEVQLTQGFVTIEHNPDTLRRMNEAAPSVIAKDGDKVVGYALTMLPSFGADVPELLPLFWRLNTTKYKDSPLTAYDYYVMGQVCVADGYRGQGIFDKLYQHHRDVYSDRYRLLITDISERNTRSLRAHERVGFRKVTSFFDDLAGETWVIVVWDWQRSE